MLHRERESVPDEVTNKGKSGITGSSGVKSTSVLCFAKLSRRRIRYLRQTDGRVSNLVFYTQSTLTVKKIK